MSKRDTVVTEFIVTEKGSAATIKKVQAVGDAAAKAQSKASGGDKGGVPPRVTPAPSKGGGSNTASMVGSAIDDISGSLTGGLQGLVSGATGIVSNLAGMVPEVGPILSAIVGAFAAAATAIVGTLTYAATKGMQAANAKDQLERMLGDAQGGDLGKGKATYKEIATKYSKTSNFGADVNAEGAMKLLGADLDWKKYLKIAEKFSQGKAEKLDQMVGAITRINSGGLGEAAESLRDLGIGRKQLEGEGLKYNKGGGIDSTADEFLKVVEKLAAKRGNLSGEGNNARVGNVEDVISQAWASFGSVIQNTILPLMEKFGDAVQSLIDSGAIEGIGDAFNNLLDTFVGDSTDGLGDLFYEVAVNIAIFIDNIGLAKEAFVALVNVLQKIPGVWIAQKLGGFVGMGAAGEMFTDHSGRREAMDNMRRMRKEQREREKAEEDMAKADKKDEPNKIDSKLDQIATNTKRTADAAEKSLDERLLGGGSFTKQAISDVSNHGGSKIGAQVAKLVDAISEDMEARFRQRLRYA